ncbi:MAG: hypothetical protein EXS08_03990 [Planctomycetes bacterium]|nr:hypothetical protein [Planctomycetota bacterium]
MASLRPVALAFLLSLVTAACHPSSSSAPLDRTFTTNLGLTGTAFDGDSVHILTVSEREEGRDLNGDGDTVDPVVHVLDLYQHSVTNTGLVLGQGPSSGYGLSPLVMSLGPTLAFGVSELATGGRDRNGDGDADDIVLAFYERDSASVTNLGLAVTFVVTTRDLLAFDVAREAVDRDGDGRTDSYVTEPFVHDRRTGETRSLGAPGALQVRAVSGEFVALAADEDELGDLNGDGDEGDYVAAFYDVGARTLQLTGFVLEPAFGGGPSAPAPHRGRWSILAHDDTRGTEHVVYDPRTGTSRNLGPFLPLVDLPGIEPFVVAVQDGSDTTRVVWLYDAEQDLLESTELEAIGVSALGERLVISVDEEAQGEDLDRNGVLAGYVPLLYDPRSGDTLNLGIAGRVQPAEHGLLIHSDEDLARRDWNGDGDREDTVLFTWDEGSGELVNTHLAATLPASMLGGDIVLVALDEDQRRDLNGDGDTLDRVLHLYESATRRLTNTGLAVRSTPPDGRDHSLYSVAEADQGRDLNGDGDLLDDVWHQTELLFFARR